MDIILSTSIELSKVSILLALLFGFGWIVIANPLRLYHNSSLRFALANLAFALVLLLDFRNVQNPTLFLWVMADIILLIAFIIYNLALRHLFKLEADPSAFTILIALVCVAYLLYLAGAFQPEWVSILSLTSVSYVMLTTFIMKFKALTEAFNWIIALILSFSDALITLLVVTKGVYWMFSSQADNTLLIHSPYSPPLLLWVQVVLIIFINTTAVGTTISRLIIRMKYLAEHDQLTGLMNRRAFQTQLNYQFSLNERYQRPFSVLMLDIDHFKSINDTLGHSAGDKAIIHTAKLLQDSVRKSDLVARFGGEEFIILLADQSISGARHIADKICLTMRQSQWRKDTPPLTMSIGCAAANQAKSPDHLLKLADDALYEAKGSGRDQAVSCVLQPAPAQLTAK